MTRKPLLMIATAFALVAAVVVLILMRRGGSAAADAEPLPTALVTVAAVRTEVLQDVVSVYGVVQSDPAGSLTVAAPKAAIISRVLVRSGQAVSAGDPLIEIANAPSSELAYRQAVDGMTFAQSELARVQRLFDERLAANDQLAAAKKALADAQATLVAEQKRGGGRALQVLAAPRAGVVTTVSSAVGEHVAQDAPLVVLARADGAAVKLGLEPGGRFAVGQAVTLRPVFGGAPIRSRLTMVGRAADQTTKTLDAIAPLNGAALPIGASVQGDVVIGSHSGQVVPRASVVFDETGPHVFVVAGGKAQRVFVTLGLDHGDLLEVTGKLTPGAQVAVEGAYELQDGMLVRARAQ
jgi:RND family efflux transporter MFP subunit